MDSCGGEEIIFLPGYQTYSFLLIFSNSETQGLKQKQSTGQAPLLESICKKGTEISRNIMQQMVSWVSQEKYEIIFFISLPWYVLLTLGIHVQLIYIDIYI